MSQPVKLWVREQNTPPSLRQPNMPNPGAKGAAKDDESLIKNSKLSAEAKEWYPRNHVQMAQGPGMSNVSSIQNRLQIHKRSSDQIGGFSDSPDMARLRQLITTLTNDPGQFDDLFEIFMETLIPYLDDDVLVVTNCVQMLVDQSINNSNFRYTGARLCYHIEQCCPNFRAELHLQCRKVLESSANKQNILLFIAELYTQLHHLNIYGNLLVDSFKKLLAQGGNDEVKCVCQALKLTGHSLEQYNKEAMDELFGLLQNAKSNVNGSALLLLNSVMNLRNANWGHSTHGDAPNSPTEEDEDDYYYPESANAVHYRMEGQTLTKEEREFLEANMHSNGDILSDSDPDELCDPEPEMDEEIQAAFKEFVKLSKR